MPVDLVPWWCPVPTGGPRRYLPRYSLRAPALGRYLEGYMQYMQYMQYIQGRTLLDPLEQCQGHGFPLNPQGIPLLFPPSPPPRPFPPSGNSTIQDFPLFPSFFKLPSCLRRLVNPGPTVPSSYFIVKKEPHLLQHSHLLLLHGLSAKSPYQNQQPIPSFCVLERIPGAHHPSSVLFSSLITSDTGRRKTLNKPAPCLVCLMLLDFREQLD